MENFVETHLPLCKQFCLCVYFTGQICEINEIRSTYWSCHGLVDDMYTGTGMSYEPVCTIINRYLVSNCIQKVGYLVLTRRLPWHHLSRHLPLPQPHYLYFLLPWYIIYPCAFALFRPLHFSLPLLFVCMISCILALALLPFFVPYIFHYPCLFALCRVSLDTACYPFVWSAFF